MWHVRCKIASGEILQDQMVCHQQVVFSIYFFIIISLKSLLILLEGYYTYLFGISFIPTDAAF